VATTDNWQIEKSTCRCASCENEFSVGQAYFSALCEAGSDFVRKDYCSSCWEGAQEASFFSFWRTRRQTGERRKRIDIAVVFDFFKKLLESEGEDRRDILFVLALYLTRRKALKLKGVRRDGARELLQFRRPRRTNIIEIEDPHLSDEQVDAATQKLKELFEDEL